MPIVARVHREGAPSGANLEYETLFTELMLAARPEEERQAGDEIIPGAEPDPGRIIDRAEAVIAQSNDLRAAVLYGYAATRVSGFAGLAEATGFIRTCLEDFWDSAHPQLDEEDDNDPTMRINAVLGLVDPDTVLRAVRGAPLTRSPAFGRMSLRDIAMAEGEIAAPEGSEPPPSPQTVSAAFQDTPPEALDEIHGAIGQAAADVAAINAVFDTRLPGQGPNLDPLAALLKKADAAVRPHLAANEDEAVPDEAAGDARSGAGPPVRTAAPGTIGSRADVERALDRIIEYYNESEPSSPLPILLKRARRLIGADFMTILQDIAPQGVENAQLIGGKENPE